MQDISYVVFPGITYSDITRILETYIKFHFGFCPKVKVVDHHMAHAASVFYTSGFEDSMIITADLTGDGKSTTLCHASDDKISVLREFKRPDSLGIFYSMITQYLGFQRDSDEYKVMGLSAYGNNTGEKNYDFSWLPPYNNKNGGNYSLNTDYINVTENNRTPPRQEPLYSEKFLSKLNNKPRRLADMPIDEYYKDIAKSAQEHLEKVALNLLEYLHEKTRSQNLCLAGGVALNVLMNQKLMESKFVENIHLTSVPGDNGLSLGAAILVAKENGFKIDRYQNPFWGPEYTNEHIEYVLTRAKVRFEHVKDISKEVAHLVAQGKIIGWFQGRMELGARALGSRSILSDPADKDMKDRLNKYVKFREDFRPFAPSVLEERALEYFINCRYAPFMAITYNVRPDKVKEIPTPTHVDNTARIQTVSQSQNGLYYDLISNFENETGIPIVTNTSLNVRDQPICLSPVDALSTFYSTGMDGIAIGNYLLVKGDG
jgi:carbamoyltransferase